MGGLTFDLALSGTLGAAAGLVVALRAWWLAKDAYAIAVGHALDASGHRRGLPIRPADPEAPPSSPGGPSSG